MDRYEFKNVKDSEYGALATNPWKELFTMFEFQEIMRQRESKQFSVILNRLREGNHTTGDNPNLKRGAFQKIVESSFH